jgi:hypothetical protein
MQIEYITMMKDYGYNKKKDFKKLFNEIEDKLICSLCKENLNKKFVPAKKYEPLNTQIIWSLS